MPAIFSIERRGHPLNHGNEGTKRRDHLGRGALVSDELESMHG